MRRALFAFVTAAVVATVLAGGAAPASANQAAESDLYSATNSSRASHGLSALSYDPAASSVARSWSQQMAASTSLAHNPNVVNQVTNQVTNQWTRIGENVGYGSSISQVQAAFMASTPHRNNILGQYNRVGVGAAQSSDGRLWVTVVFIQGPSIAPPVDTSGPGTVGRADGRLEVVQRAPDGTVQIRTLTGSGWTGWSPLGGMTPADPDLASWGSDRLDVFVLGNDGAIWHRQQSGSGWGPWYSLGGRLVSAPTAASWAPGRLDVFARGTDGAVWSRNYSTTTGAWSGWYSLGGYIVDAPDVASWGPNRLDVFGVGGDGQMWHKAWDGQRFGAWEPLGGRFTSGPGVASVGSNRLDMFARGADGAVWSMAWTGSRWTGWSSLGGVVVSSPDAAVRSGALEVLARAGDGRLYRQTHSGGWTGWARLP